MEMKQTRRRKGEEARLRAAGSAPGNASYAVLEGPRVGALWDSVIVLGLTGGK